MMLGIYTCREALSRLDDYLDRELTPIELKRMERHLKICHNCARKFQTEAAFVREVRDKIIRLDVPQQLLHNISEALNQVGRQERE